MQVNVQRTYDAPAASLFKMCSTPAFFARSGALLRSGFMDFREGGRFRYEFTTGGNLWGEYQKIVSNREIVFTWSSDHAKGPAEDTLVTIKLEPKGGETLFSISHQGFKTEQARAGHETGWTSVFETLGADFNSWLGAAVREDIKLGFKFSQRYKCPAQDVFNAFQREDSITNFFVKETSGPLVEGSVVQWKFRNHADKTYNIHVQKVVPAQKIVFQWMDAQVSMDFENLAEGGSRWTIAADGWQPNQEGIDDSYSECEGWREVMGSLKEWFTATGKE